MATKHGLKKAMLRQSVKDHIKKHGRKMVRLSDDQIDIEMKPAPNEVYRSDQYLVQVYYISDDIERLSICRLELEPSGRWRGNLSWDELQAIKSMVGRGDRDAVEIYPRDHDVVNVANLRHLWVFKKDYLGFAWRQGKPE